MIEKIKLYIMKDINELQSNTLSLTHKSLVELGKQLAVKDAMEKTRLEKLQDLRNRVEEALVFTANINPPTTSYTRSQAMSLHLLALVEAYYYQKKRIAKLKDIANTLRNDVRAMEEHVDNVQNELTGEVGSEEDSVSLYGSDESHTHLFPCDNVIEYTFQWVLGVIIAVFLAYTWTS